MTVKEHLGEILREPKEERQEQTGYALSAEEEHTEYGNAQSTNPGHGKNAVNSSDSLVGATSVW